MRILGGTRPLHEVELHLLDREAQRLIASLSDCRDDLAEVGMSESHERVLGSNSEVRVYVYATEEELEAEVVDRMSDNS